MVDHLKPMSSSRSASSRTSMRRLLSRGRSVSVFCRWSNRRPGVATCTHSETHRRAYRYTVVGLRSSGAHACASLSTLISAYSNMHRMVPYEQSRLLTSMSGALLCRSLMSLFMFVPPNITCHNIAPTTLPRLIC